MKYQFDQPTQIFIAITDLGDGSNSIDFFDSQEAYDLAKREDPEKYWCDGGTTITVTGVFDAGEDWDEILTLADVKKRHGIE